MCYVRMIAVLLVPFVLLALAGCGSSTGSTVTPFSSGASGSGGSGSTVSQGGAIIFTSSAGAKPGSQVDLLTPGSATVDPAKATFVEFQQLIPFLVTDSLGNPRAGVPVTLSLYSINGNPNGVTIDFQVTNSEPNQQTVTTDSAGMGIFNVSVVLAVDPVSGLNNLETLVFKAVTNDVPPVAAYVGNSYNVISKTGA